MYSRYGNDTNRPIRLPDHYSGSAFSQRPTDPVTVSKREPAKPLPRGGVEEKVSPIADRLLHADTAGKEGATESAFTTGATNATGTTRTTGTADATGTTNSADSTFATGTANTAFTTNTTDFSNDSEKEGEQERKSSLPPTHKLFGSSPINFAGLRRLLGGEGGDEDHDRLLLLGLILLLSRAEGDSDILLWLSLLLLCG